MFTATLNKFAQTTDNVVTVPVETNIDGADVETAANVVFWTSSILFVLGLINFVMFIIALVHLIQNPAVPNRTLWIILIIFVPFASWVYVFGPRRTFSKSAAAAGSQNPFPQQNQNAFPSANQPTANANPYQAVPQQPQPPAPQPFAQPQQPVTPVTPPTIQQPNLAEPTPQPQQPQPVTFAPQPPTTPEAPQPFNQDPPQDRQV